MIANLKGAAWNRESVTIAGGVFTPAELLEAARKLDTHGALVDALMLALPFVEDAEDDPCYKPGAVKKAIAQIRATLTQAGAI